HGETWTKEAGIVGALTNFHRGFPASLIGGSAAILASREALRTQPITRLSVLNDFGRLGELMALAELSRVRELSVGPALGSYRRHLTLPAEQFALIARSPHLAGRPGGALRPPARAAGALSERP
ncbi:MAG: hypothetical protein IT380_00955, partial [Myxococcales bacterium]|nr:hypothetical protein [Myxococcales bacterium]